jgi:hypothetical protein
VGTVTIDGVAAAASAAAVRRNTLY